MVTSQTPENEVQRQVQPPPYIGRAHQLHVTKGQLERNFRFLHAEQPPSMAIVLLAKPNDQGAAEVQFFAEYTEDGKGVVPIDCRQPLEEKETDNMANWVRKVNIEAAFMVFHIVKYDADEFGILNAQRALACYDGPIYMVEDGVATGKYKRTFFDESGEAYANKVKPLYAPKAQLPDKKVALFALTLTLGKRQTSTRTSTTRPTVDNSPHKSLAGSQVATSALPSTQEDQ